MLPHLKKLILLTLLPLSAFGMVDMNNACYSNTWTDLEVPGSGYNLRVLRAYKSRSLYNGMYGFGWCSEFETRLSVTPEGGVKISECGDGQEIFFSAKELSRSEVDDSINRIVAKMKTAKASSGFSGDYWAQLKSKLLKEPGVRADYATQYGVVLPVKDGVKMLANGRESESVTLQNKVYTRILPDGSSQRFDLNGHLNSMYNQNGNFLKLNYAKDQLIEVEDNNFNKLTFKYYSNGKVQKVTGPNSKFTEYRYSESEDLIWNKNALSKSDTEVYTYEYNEYHNLTKATWPDKSFITLKYDNLKDWVIAFAGRDRCTENYKYESSAASPALNYWATTTKICDKEVVATNRYEFWHKQLPTGQTILSRIQTNLSGNIRDVVYDDMTGKPLSIKNNADLSEYAYFPNGLLKTKRNSESILEFDYDNEIKKVSKVTVTHLHEKKQSGATEFSSFKYDSKGNLIFAENSEGKKIKMVYDFLGHIISIVDGQKTAINLKYEDQFGKPSEVQRADLGSVKISYDSNGEIASVESKQGPEVAAKIASSYNNLMRIIAPATQNIY